MTQVKNSSLSKIILKGSAVKYQLGVYRDNQNSNRLK